MAWRGLHLSKPCRLSLADAQIVVSQDRQDVRLAIEDIGWIVVDTPQATLTTALIGACMESGIAIITTDARHAPSGLLLPFHRHYRQAGVAAAQVGASPPLKKRLWQAIVQAKIANQAAALGRCGRDSRALKAMARQVGSGDPDNTEARAARQYWGQLFQDFVRENGADLRNMLLNYGYAVVRSALARASVAFGLLPALGLHHASVTNAFNLADDLVEPFRPFVDVLVWEMSDQGRRAEGQPSVTDRRELAAVLLRQARFGSETVTLLTASERTAEGLVSALEGASPALLRLPLLE
jgi:CRISP-associated protein Cas1